MYTMIIDSNINGWHKFVEATQLTLVGPWPKTIQSIEEALVEYNAVFEYRTFGSSINFETEQDYVVFKLKFG